MGVQKKSSQSVLGAMKTGKFIEFWQREIEGPLHSVRFTHRKMISPGEWRNVTGEFTYH